MGWGFEATIIKFWQDANKLAAEQSQAIIERLDRIAAALESGPPKSDREIKADADRERIAAAMAYRERMGLPN